MATHKVEIKVTEKGAQQAAQQLGRVDSALAKVAKGASAAAAAYFGGHALISAFKTVVAAAGEQEQAERQLAQALGHTSTALLQQAAALQQVSTYGDETIIRAQAMLAAFVDDENQIKQATKATLDLAAAKGMDLVTAADLVSKTLGSSTNALSRYGITVEGDVGSTERLSTLVTEISKKFGGQAAAAADTMAGSIQQAKNAAGDAAEVIGAALAPAVRGAASFVKGFSGAIIDLAADIKTVVTGMLDMDDAVRNFTATGVKAQIGLLQEALATTTQAMQEYERGGIQLLVAGGRKGADALAWLKEHAKSLENQIATLQGRLEDLSGPVLDAAPVTIDLAVATETADTSFRELAVSVQSAGAALQEYTMAGQTTREEWEAMLAAYDDDRWTREQERIEDTAEAMRNAGVSNVEIAQWQDAEEEKLHQRRLQRDRMEAASHARAVGSLVGSLAQLNQASHGSAVLTKRLMQAQAIIDTYAGANRALASGPPPWNFIQAAAVVASGLANVAKIQAQHFARGGDFVTAGPQVIVVGDNPGGRERVQVTPLSSPNFDGPQGARYELHFHGPVTDEAYVEDVIAPALARVTRLQQGAA